MFSSNSVRNFCHFYSFYSVHPKKAPDLYADSILKKSNLVLKGKKNGADTLYPITLYPNFYQNYPLSNVTFYPYYPLSIVLIIQ